MCSSDYSLCKRPRIGFEFLGILQEFANLKNMHGDVVSKGTIMEIRSAPLSITSLPLNIGVFIFISNLSNCNIVFLTFK